MSVYGYGTFGRFEQSTDPNSIALVGAPTFARSARGMHGLLPGLSCNQCITGSHPTGMGSLGLFDTGLDISGWTWQEWAIVAGAGAAVYYFWFGPSDKRAAIRKAREQYVRKVRSIDQQFSTRSRIARRFPKVRAA